MKKKKNMPKSLILKMLKAKGIAIIRNTAEDGSRAWFTSDGHAYRSLQEIANVYLVERKKVPSRLKVSTVKLEEPEPENVKA